MKKELEKEEINLLDISQQIEHLKREASILKKQRQQKKIRNKFEKKYEDFNEILNSDMLLLEPNDRKEIKVLLENVSAVIKDTVSKLD